jgi:hypothetical protein
MSLRNGVASSLRKNANEQEMGALEWLAADRHPTLPNEEKDERAETRDESDEGGVFVEIVKRSGCAASSTGRRDIWARIDDALQASTVLEYNILVNPSRQASSAV